MYNALVLQQQVHLAAALSIPDTGIAHVGCPVNTNLCHCIGAAIVKDNGHQLWRSCRSFGPTGLSEQSSGPLAQQGSQSKLVKHSSFRHILSQSVNLELGCNSKYNFSLATVDRRQPLGSQEPYILTETLGSSCIILLGW